MVSGIVVLAIVMLLEYMNNINNKRDDVYCGKSKQS